MNPREHYIIGVRNTLEENGKTYWRPDYKRHRKLAVHWQKYKLPNTVNEHTRADKPVKGFPENFIDDLIEEMKQLPERQRTVTFYIHGWHRFKKVSHKLDILDNLSKTYGEGGPVGKFVFLSWPSSGLRHLVDDRAFQIGHLFGKNHLSHLKELRDRLHEIGGKMILMAHSFGHHVLNGILSTSASFQLQRPLFDHVFLFASDIAHQSVFRNETTSGVLLGNPLAHLGPQIYPERNYNLTDLARLSSNNHVFYHRYDVMLHNSTFMFAKKMFSGLLDRLHIDNEELAMIQKSFCLGNLGGEKLLAANPDFDFVNVKELMDDHPRDRKTFKVKRKKRDKIDEFLEEPRKFVGFGIGNFAASAFKQKHYVGLHQYLFSADSVVKEVKGKMG